MTFDHKYYQRYYGGPRTAVNTRADMRRLARLISTYAEYIEFPIKRILDAGCGAGWLRAPFKRMLPAATYTGLEYSDYLCKRYGWKQGSIDTFRSRHRFQLIVCNGVLQYLDDRAAAQALANLARLSDGLLYFNALTIEDWRLNCERESTDGDVHLRASNWYKTRLHRKFHHVGAGLWLRRGLGITLWSLERD